MIESLSEHSEKLSHKPKPYRRTTRSGKPKAIFTRWGAETAIARIREARERGETQHQEDRRYWCSVCRGFHLTSSKE